MPTLYDDIKEAEKILNINLEEGDDNGEDNERGVREEQPVRRGAGHDTGEGSEQGEGEDSGTGGRGRSPEGTPRSEGGASSGDARTSQKDSGGTQEDAPAPQEDGEAVLEKPLTNADWARQRRENRELKARLAKLEAEKSAPATAASAKEEPKPEAKDAKAEPEKEPDKTQNYQAWLEWKIAKNDSTIEGQQKLIEELREERVKTQKKEEEDRVTNAAIEEFTDIEEAYKKQNPDYENAIEFARKKYLDAAKMFYPDKTEKQIEEAIDKQMLQYASGYAARGLNPAEELYDLVQERFGYVKTEPKVETQEEKPRQEARPRQNLKIVNENRRRSASPLGNGGQSGSIPITKEIAADMSLGEFSRLTPDDLMNLENMG